MSCAKWEGRTQQRDAEIRQLGREIDKRAKHDASNGKNRTNSCRKVILLKLGKVWQYPARRGNIQMEIRYR